MLKPEQYGGSHLAYLSRYTQTSDPLYSMTAEQLLDAYLPHLRKIYPAFQRDWVTEAYSWRDRYTQPVVGLHYSTRIPAMRSRIGGLWLCSMAQIYPEDRGMNYAVAYGRKVAAEMIRDIQGN
jgi:protoporphyrinogen oxidase